MIEDPQKNNEEYKIWNKIPIPRKERGLMCRHGHDSLLIDDSNILIFGGLSSGKTDQTVLFNINTNKFVKLKNLNDPPSNRFFLRLIGSGNGVVLMYGGEDKELPLSEYWMFKVDVNAKTVKYSAYKPKSSYFSLIFAWREGFSFHHSIHVNHPIIIGGGFGNNQQGNALLSLPTITCANKEEFESGDCTPCPRNSFYNVKLKL